VRKTTRVEVEVEWDQVAVEKTQEGKEEPRRKGAQRATEKAQAEVDEL